MSSFREALADLRARGRVPEGTAERVAVHLTAALERPPWYLVGLTVLGAWVATLFLLVGVGALLDWSQGAGLWAVVAVVSTGAGLGARRLSRGLFLGQASIALCLAGWGAACTAGGLLFDALGGALAAGLIFAVAITLLHPDAATRFLVAAGTAVLLVAWFFDQFRHQPLLALNPPVSLLALGGGLLLARPGVPRALVPLGHACLLTAAAAIPVLGLERSTLRSGIDWWPSVLVLGLGLAALVVQASRPADAQVRREALPMALIAVALLALASLPGGPGLLMAAGLLVLGHATARRPLEIFGLVALPAFLFLHYRGLDLSLMAKSLSLVASGLVLLGLRRALAGRPWARALS